MKETNKTIVPTILYILIIFVMFFGLTNSIKADNNPKAKVEVIQQGSTFSIKSNNIKIEPTKTNYTFKDSKGIEYPIYLTSKGKAFVYKTSKKTGKQYKYYLPKEIENKIK